jgi:hypothetical protein
MKSIVISALLMLAGGLSVWGDVMGTVYEGLTCLSNGTCDADSALSNVTAATPSAQFTVPGINFNSGTTGYDIDTFLNIPDASFSNLMNGFNPTDTSDNTLMVFTGSIFLSAGDNNFTVEHDDGLNITLDGGIGTALDVPGPTGAVSTPFDIVATTAGVYNYTLSYDECCGPPAVLQWAYLSGAPVGAAPEPGTWLLLGTGLAVMIRRLRR